jgi:glutathione S-transferase
VLPRQLTLFVDGYFTSTWDASCFVALTEKQLEFTTARALLRDGQGAPARLKEQTAIARIPALQHGDFLLTESLAIVEYIEDSFPPPAYTRLLPAAPEPRARARQTMAWLRFDLRALRAERPWQFAIYPAAIDPDDPLPPLSPEAERDAGELIDLVGRLAASGELDEWNIAHADLTFALWRIARCGYALPPAAQRLVDRNVQRPSIQAYLEHPRPPNPPPRVRVRWTS